MIVEILYTTKIPSEAVTYSVLGYGGSFNGGIKSTLLVKIDMSVNGSASMSVNTRSWGATRKYNDDDTLAVTGKPDWFKSLRQGAGVLEEDTLGETDTNLLASWQVPQGASHGVKLMVAGGNPLLTLAPVIDGELTVGLRNNGGRLQYTISGDHDGFPDHQVSINGAVVYFHDCVEAGKNPGALAPPSEVDVSISNWTNL